MKCGTICDRIYEYKAIEQVEGGDNMFHIWKDVRQNFSISSLITLALGIILIVWPDLSGNFMCYMLGIALILMGIIQLQVFTVSLI